MMNTANILLKGQLLITSKLTHDKTTNANIGPTKTLCKNIDRTEQNK